MQDVSVVIVAAGSSTRIGGIKKQFLSLCGVPVLIRSCLAFEELAEIKEIVIVTKEEDVAAVKTMVHEFELSKVATVTAGGATRQQSVFRGVKACCSQTTIVAVHDAARPLVQPDDIVHVLADARRFGAATLGVLVKDTVKMVNAENTITATPDRACLYLTQTPQVFEKSLYLQAAAQASTDGVECTDDCQLLERFGVPVHMTPGSYNNIKITTREDIPVSRAILKSQEGELL